MALKEQILLQLAKGMLNKFDITVICVLIAQVQLWKYAEDILKTVKEL